MPQPQKFYRRDPDEKGRGAGYYYARSVNGRRVHSKYSPFRDANKRVRKVHPKLKPKYDHTADRKTRPSSHRTHVGTRRKRVLGWF